MASCMLFNISSLAFSDRSSRERILFTSISDTNHWAQAKDRSVVLHPHRVWTTTGEIGRTLHTPLHHYQAICACLHGLKGQKKCVHLYFSASLLAFVLLAGQMNILNSLWENSPSAYHRPFHHSLLQWQTPLDSHSMTFMLFILQSFIQDWINVSLFWGGGCVWESVWCEWGICAPVCADACACAHSCGGQKRTLGILLCHFLPFSFKTDLSLNL